MNNCIRWVAGVILVAVLSSCADFNKQTYKPSSVGPIKSILIATQSNFPKAEFGHDLKKGALGLTSTTISLSTADGTTQTLDETLAQQGPRYHEQLLADLIRAFSRAGISTQVIAVEKNRSTGLIEDYQSLTSARNVDAILDLHVLEAGYGDPQIAHDLGLRPILRIRARLVSAKDFKTLYADDISFGANSAMLDSKLIQAPKKYYFHDTPLVLFEKKRAAEGLNVAAKEIAQFLVAQFAAPAGITTK